MSNHSTTYVGLDVHKDSITVACAIDAGQVELFGKTGITGADIDRLCRRIQSKRHTYASSMKQARAATPSTGSSSGRFRLHGLRAITDPAQTPANV
jgi:hypothetical protein